MKEYIHNSINFKVGQNATENWKLILSSDKSHWWVHADDVASAHVVVETDVILPSDIEYACHLCKFHSKKATNKFTYTQINNLKLGSVPGEVYFKTNAIYKINITS